MVEREDDVATRPLLARRDDVDRVAGGIADDDLVARPPAERPLEGALEPVEPAVVGPGEAEQMRRDRALRIRAALLRIEAEPGDALLLERLRLYGSAFRSTKTKRFSRSRSVG